MPGIKTKITAKNISSIENMAFYGQIEDIVEDIGNSIYEGINGPMLEEITYEPGLPSYPIDWQTEKQRQAFFASDGFGGGIPHKRKGSQNKWSVNLTASQGRVIIDLSNPLPQAKYIWGGFIERTRDSQQRMHVGRWPTAYTIAEKYTTIGKRVYDEELQKRLANPEQYVKVTKNRKLK